MATTLDDRINTSHMLDVPSGVILAAILVLVFILLNHQQRVWTVTAPLRIPGSSRPVPDPPGNDRLRALLKTPSRGLTTVWPPTPGEPSKAQHWASTPTTGGLELPPVAENRGYERLVVELTPQASAELSRLARIEGLNRSTVVNRAVHVYAYTSDADRRGDVLLVQAAGSRGIDRISFQERRH